MTKTKRIVVLSDGTGNAASKVWRTNVWRVFETVDLSTPEQVAKYDEGVGSSSFKPAAFLGSTFESGLKRIVIDLSSQPVACVRHIGSGGPLKPEGQGGSR
jgi:uncharacterized protein (DUF2235 family)